MNDLRNVIQLLIDGIWFGEVEALNRVVIHYHLSYLTGDEVIVDARKNGRGTVLKEILSFIANGKCKAFEIVYTHASNTPLHLAAENADMKKLKNLLCNGAKVNSLNATGETPLHHATKGEHLEVMQLFIDHGADVNARDVVGQTPLHFAVQIASEEAVELLLSAGADLEVRTKAGLTPLLAAIELGLLGVVKLMLQFEPDVNNPECVHTAVRQLFKTSNEIVDALLDYGFSVRTEDLNRPNFFHHAVYVGNLRVVRQLVDLGADMCVGHKSYSKGTVIRERDSLLHSAILMNELEIVEFLIENQKDCDFRKLCNARMDFPIDYAARFDEKGVITKILLTNQHTITDHQKLWRLALESGRPCTIEALLEHMHTGSDYNIFTDLRFSSTTDNGRTLLHEAARFGYEEIISLFIRKKADVNVTTNLKQTPLHIAAIEGHKNVAVTLLQNGAAIDAADDQGFTALHIVVQKNREYLIEPLLEFGADPNAVNHEGDTALHLAVSDNKNWKTVTRLLNHGADVNILNHEQKTALNGALIHDENMRSETIEVLCNHIFKRMIARMYVNEENREAMKMSLKLVKAPLRQTCVKEVVNMMSKFLEDTKISCSDILRHNSDTLERILRNEKIARVLYSYDYAQHYPIYAGMIKFNLNQAMDRTDLIEKAHICLQMSHNGMPKLPFYCIEEIFRYLSNRDIKMFINSCK